jgi:hypothetical protein
MAIAVTVNMLSGGPRFDYDVTGIDFTYGNNVRVLLLAVDGIPVLGVKVIAAYSPYEDISTTPSTVTDVQGQAKSNYDKLTQRDSVGGRINTVVPRGKTIQCILTALMLDGTIQTSDVITIVTDAPIPIVLSNPYRAIKER